MRIRSFQIEEEEATINMTPLVDMVFLLLIFFLVATTFAQEERDNSVQLPSTYALHPLSQPPRQVIVNISAAGALTVSGRPCSYAELADMLGQVARAEPDREVLIRADEMSLHKYFAEVADICRRVGVNPLKVGYLLRAESPAATN